MECMRFKQTQKEIPKQKESDKESQKGKDSHREIWRGDTLNKRSSKSLLEVQRSARQLHRELD